MHFLFLDPAVEVAHDVWALGADGRSGQRSHLLQIQLLLADVPDPVARLLDRVFETVRVISAAEHDTEVAATDAPQVRELLGEPRLRLAILFAVRSHRRRLRDREVTTLVLVAGEGEARLTLSRLQPVFTWSPGSLGAEGIDQARHDNALEIVGRHPGSALDLCHVRSSVERHTCPEVCNQIVSKVVNQIFVLTVVLYPELCDAFSAENSLIPRLLAEQ